MTRLAQSPFFGCLALALSCAAATAAEPVATPTVAAITTPAGAVATPTSAELAPVQAVAHTTIDPNIKRPVCRRYAPTGSRIVTRICEIPGEDTPDELQAREDARRNLEDLRLVQQARDQARAAAMADAWRRRSNP